MKCNSPECAGKCLTVGHVTDGSINVTKDYPCEQGKPEKNKWFTVKLEVRGQTTKVFLNNAEVVNYSHYHDNVARGGAVLFNSYQGRVYFRGYNVSHLESMTTPAAGAKYDDASANDTQNGSVGKPVTLVTDRNVTMETMESGTMETSTKVPNDKITTSKTVTETTYGCGSYYVYKHASYLRSRSSDRGLCRLLIPSSLVGDGYTASVNMRKGLFSSSAASGVMYNAQDVNNFDFFYYDFGKMSVCITTGTVQEGRMRLDERRFAICPLGGLFSWYNMTVQVTNKKAKIYINEKNLVTARANHRPRPQGGVVIANGQGDVVDFRDFKINLGN